MAVVPKKTVSLPDWSEITPEFTERCVFMDIIGVENCGKTTLALSAPGPVGVIHNGDKVRGVANKIVRENPGKVIRDFKYGFAGTGVGTADKPLAEPVWAKIKANYTAALTGWARTIVVDTGNAFWDMARLARFGVLTPKGNRMDALWGPVNHEMRSLLQTQFRAQTKCNVITIHQMGDEYVDKPVNGEMRSVKTGRFIRKGGFKEVPFIADVIVRMERTAEGGHQATITKGWFNTTVEGIPLTDDLMKQLGYSGLNFSSIMAYITELPEDEWTK